jgi:hypothetical protein
VFLQCYTFTVEEDLEDKVSTLEFVLGGTEQLVDLE